MPNAYELTPEAVNATEIFSRESYNFEFDFCDVKGQENIKRALEIAAAGAHNAII